MFHVKDFQFGIPRWQSFKINLVSSLLHFYLYFNRSVDNAEEEEEEIISNAHPLYVTQLFNNSILFWYFHENFKHEL